MLRTVAAMLRLNTTGRPRSLPQHIITITTRTEIERARANCLSQQRRSDNGIAPLLHKHGTHYVTPFSMILMQCLPSQ
jgi:hypothetical protein